jgi:hypothetical protein
MPMKENPYVTAMPNELFGDRCVACRLNNDEFLMYNGTPSMSFVFNAKTLAYKIGGAQPKLPVMAKGWKQTDYTMAGPKLQQIFDMQPPKHNGIFYLIHNSLAEDQLRVIYGIKHQWSTSREISPTPEA